MKEIKKTAKHIDLNSLKISKSSGNVTRYYCPNCIIKINKSDDEGTLSFNHALKKGWCYRCHTAFFVQGKSVLEELDDASDYLSGNQSVKIADNTLITTTITTKIIQKKTHQSFAKAELSNKEIIITPLIDRHKIYLENRNPFILEISDFLGLKSAKYYRDAIFIPFLFNGEVFQFQLRFTDLLKPKHYTSVGDKIPYSPDHLLFDVNSVQSLNAITLCEGVFDAIALRIMGYPNPFAVLGSVITDYQMDILRNFEFEEIYCAFDNEYLNKENIKNIINLFPFVSQHNSIVFPKIDDIQPDPEEFLRYKSKLNQDLYDKYKENTHKWLLNVSNKSRSSNY